MHALTPFVPKRSGALCVVLALAYAGAGAAPRGRAALPPAGACVALSGAQMIVRQADGTVLTGPAEGPLKPVPGVSDAVAVSAGDDFLVLRRDGTVLMWSSNGNAQPTAVSGLRGVVRIASGARHHVALLEDGTVDVFWSRARSPGPELTGGLRAAGESILHKRIKLDGAVDVAAGLDNVFVLLRDGTIRAWGNNNHHDGGGAGVLGIGHGQSVTVPTPVVGITTATSVHATRGYVAQAILEDGTVKTWGNTQVEYARPNTADPLDSAVPVTIPQLAGAIALTDRLALFADGIVKEWKTPQAPITPVAGINNAVAIATGVVLAGLRYAVVLRDGRVIMWSQGKRMNVAQNVVANIGADGAASCAMVAQPKSQAVSAPPVATSAPAANPGTTPRRVSAPRRSTPLQTGTGAKPPHLWAGTIIAVRGFPDSHSSVRETFTADVVFENQFPAAMLAQLGQGERSGPHMLRAGSTVRWELSGTDKYGCTYTAEPLLIELLPDDATINVSIVPGVVAGYTLEDGHIHYYGEKSWQGITTELTVTCPTGEVLRNTIEVRGPWLEKPPADPRGRQISEDLKTITGSSRRKGATFSWKLTHELRTND